MLYGKSLLQRNNYDEIKTLSYDKLPEKIKNILYMNDDMVLYKNKETDDIIYVSDSTMELYLDTLDGEPYSNLTKHETFKDYVYIKTGSYYMYEHKDNINTLMDLDVVHKHDDKYYTFSYGWVDLNDCYWGDDIHYGEEE